MHRRVPSICGVGAIRSAAVRHQGPSQVVLFALLLHSCAPLLKEDLWSDARTTFIVVLQGSTRDGDGVRRFFLLFAGENYRAEWDRVEIL